MKRTSGILLSLTSLPSRHGIGDLGPSAYAFVDFCKEAGQRYWQILPINPTDGINGHSPYSSPSAFAGNSLLISLELLVEEGLLTSAELAKIPASTVTHVDYPKTVALKNKWLDKAFQRFAQRELPSAYCQFEANNTWLEDYALFIAIKRAYDGASWDQWPMPLRTRQAKALKEIKVKYAESINKTKFIQYIFYKQWIQLKSYANAKGIGIIGDIPIYVNDDSSDVWCAPQFFQIDTKGHLKFVSGCPPDYFSKTGQRWGNPTYHWANLKKDKYRWWIARIRHNLELFDSLRIDHFRGFVGFWQIPAHEKLAVFGRWVKAPGAHFFKTVQKEFGSLPIIAEDLGEITEDVTRLMNDFHFPGMRVLLFAFGGDPKTNPYVPANYVVNCVAYTGTHDNNTVQGWLRSEAKDYERANLVRVLGQKVRPDQLHWTMIEVLEQSKAATVILSMADILGLDQQARMNTPATTMKNWAWRLNMRQASPLLAKKLKTLSIKSGRYENNKT